LRWRSKNLKEWTLGATLGIAVREPPAKKAFQSVFPGAFWSVQLLLNK
jgi:hypothetical protein